MERHIPQERLELPRNSLMSMAKKGCEFILLRKISSLCDTLLADDVETSRRVIKVSVFKDRISFAGEYYTDHTNISVMRDENGGITAISRSAFTAFDTSPLTETPPVTSSIHLPGEYEPDPKFLFKVMRDLQHASSASVEDVANA